MKLIEKDRIKTIENRRRLLSNRNLLYWYHNLYACQFSEIKGLDSLCILEVGSGTSPLKQFYPTVLTSDVMALDYLDYSFDCHRIDEMHEIADGTVDILSATNVLHHLRTPLAFIRNASVKLKEGGKLILTEPYFSLVSRSLYQHIHHEYSSFEIDEPIITRVDGPLTSANLAMPHAIFFSKKGWDRRLTDIYQFDTRRVKHFTSLSYFLTGGISRMIPIPHSLYQKIFKIDYEIAKRKPIIFSSFFILELTKIVA